MRYQPVVSFIPFLSILVGSLAVLGFVTMTVALVAGGRDSVSRNGAIVHAQWEGAPAYIRAVLLECRPDGVTFYGGRDAPARFFSMERLNREAAVVHDLQERGTAQAGAPLTRDQEWLFFKAVIERDQRLRDTLTLALHKVEISNLNGEGKSKRDERYPIILVAPDALDSYDLATELMDLTSRMPVGVEPLLPGWRVQPDSGNPGVPAGSAGRTAPLRGGQ